MKFNLIRIGIIAIFLYPCHILGQKTDLEFGLLNMGIGGLIGGVGAVINSKPNDKFVNVLIKGIGKGAIGGYFVFESKRLIRNFDKNGDLIYVWPSKIVNAAGTSIIENASANKAIHESFAIPIGFTRLELFPKENFKLSVRIKPIALIGTIITSTKGDFNWEKSLKTGNFIFITDHIENEKLIDGFTAGRASFGSSILILDSWEGESALPHEILHIYQIESFVGINQYLDKPLNKIPKSYYQTYSQIFYIDFHILPALGLYNLASQGGKGYSGNIFEKEANYFSRYERKNPISPEFFIE